MELIFGKLKSRSETFHCILRLVGMNACYCQVIELNDCFNIVMKFEQQISPTKPNGQDE